MHLLLLGRIVMIPLLLELLHVHVTKLGRFHVIRGNSLVSLTHDLSMLASDLLEAVIDLLLRSLLPPLRDLFLIGGHLQTSSVD